MARVNGDATPNGLSVARLMEAAAKGVELFAAGEPLCQSVAMNLREMGFMAGHHPRDRFVVQMSLERECEP